jgi:hypothetical protein
VRVPPPSLKLKLKSIDFPVSPNGIRFTAAAGTTEFNKRWNPQSGDIVSFKHHGFLLTSKKPKFPTLHRLRPDLKWDSVVQNWKEQKPTPAGSITSRPLMLHID